MSLRPVLTEEQLRKQADRKAAKLAKKQDANIAKVEVDGERIEFLRREWIRIGHGRSTTLEGGRSRVEQEEERESVRIVTWNMLAQTLVRRELFPGSDCLRWTERKPMLVAELAAYRDCDVVCLQECDRLSHLTPSLPYHSYVNASGPKKLHGLVIFYRKDRFKVKSSRTIYLDDEELQRESNGSPRERRGGSRQTKNVGLLVALEHKDKEGKGIVIATTHLFWHPKFAYERSRQSLILIRNIQEFQAENNISHWPAVLAGDLNTQPNEATYQLLTNPLEPLPVSLTAQIETSRFVHTSVDNIGVQPTESNGSSGAATPADKEEGEDELPDTDERSVANTRSPMDGDGILETSELIDLAQKLMPNGGCRSALASGEWASDKSETFAGRDENEARLTDGGVGGGEPRYTCYSPLFRLTLDYLLLLPAKSPEQVTAVLHPARKEELGDGLPSKGVCAADHLAMGAEITF